MGGNGKGRTLDARPRNCHLYHCLGSAARISRVGASTCSSCTGGSSVAYLSNLGCGSSATRQSPRHHVRSAMRVVLHDFMGNAGWEVFIKYLNHLYTLVYAVCL